MNSEKLASILELLHSNTFSENSMQLMLDELQRNTNSSIALIIESDKDSVKSPKLTFSSEMSNIAQVMNHYSLLLTQDPFYHFVNGFPHENPVKLNTCVYKQIQSSPLSDYYRDIGIRYILGVLIDTPLSQIAFAVNRDPRHKDYTCSDNALVKMLIPHIKIAAINRQRYSFLQNRANDLIRAVELSGKAVGVITYKQELISCTSLFYNNLLSGNLLSSSFGKFQFRSNLHQSWLEKTIKIVVDYNNHQTQTLRISTEPLMEIHLTMLSQVSMEPLFLLCLHTADTIAKWWEFSYKFTSKELALIDCFVKGLSLPEISDLFQVSHNTIRTHMQHILFKTGCRSQNQLLVKLLSPKNGLHR